MPWKQETGKKSNQCDFDREIIVQFKGNDVANVRYSVKQCLICLCEDFKLRITSYN